jgi:hypothetical protein
LCGGLAREFRGEFCEPRADARVNGVVSDLDGESAENVRIDNFIDVVFTVVTLRQDSADTVTLCSVKRLRDGDDRNPASTLVGDERLSV